MITAFTFAYAFGQTGFGKVFDRIGTLSLRHFSALRFLAPILGVLEAGNRSGAAQANADWFSINERALAICTVFSVLIQCPDIKPLKPAQSAQSTLSTSA